MKILRIPVLLILALLLLNCSAKQIKRGSFSYGKVYEQNYTNGKGGVIPLTIEKGESFGGQITQDGNYLFFSSNKYGNYDIFARDLTGVSVTPVVKTATNQREPAISADGKRLVYIDDELDPDGDLVIREIEINKFIEAEQTRGEGAGAKFLKKALVLTNDEMKRVRSRESNPTWSNNGQLLAFSSDMLSVVGSTFGPGLMAVQNIWVAQPENFAQARQLTKNGGVMPAFSPDDRSIVYISYENQQNNGDIYEVDISSGRITPIYLSVDLKLNPAYSADGKFIIFTKISQDTNGDGVIDRKDFGQIVKIARKPFKLEELSSIHVIPLTLSRQNLFDTKYSRFLNGSILFALGQAEDINIAIISAEGIVPRRASIAAQYHLIAQYYPQNFVSEEYQDRITASNLYVDNWLKEQQRQKNTEQQSLAFENYFFAMRKFHDFYQGDDLYHVFAARVEIRKLDFLLKTAGSEAEINLVWQNLLRMSANSASDISALYAKILLDLYVNKNSQIWKALGNAEKGSAIHTFTNKVLRNHRPLAAVSDFEYITQIFDNNLLETVKESQIKTLADEKEKIKIGKIQQQLHSELKKLRADFIAVKNPAKATEIYIELVKNNPEYFDLAEVFFAKGRLDLKDSLSSDLVHLLDLNKATLPGWVTGFGQATADKISLQLSKTMTPAIKDKVEKTIFAFFQDKVNSNERGVVDSQLQIYTEAKNKMIHMLGNLAYGEFFTEKGDHKSALKYMQLIKNNIPPKTLWQFYFTKIYGGIRELLNEPAQAFLNYYTAIIEYEGRFGYKDILPFIDRIIGYYERTVDRFMKRADYEKAWLSYRFLMGLYLELYGKNVARDVVNRKALKTFLQINSMAIESMRVSANNRGNVLIGSSVDTSLADKIDEFYESKINVAYQQLNNEFIFSRANLKVQYGVFLQKHYEVNGIGKQQKEKVLQLFKGAENDLRWSFFANPIFANSYLLLGWMYQFIDENKENVVSQAKNTKDKDEFARLYALYFPSYLFEENIRLYQKSISMFKNTEIRGVLGNLNLNIGNNYFLLNNYNKAEESYEMVLKDSEGGEANLEFESDLQKASFYFHLGKTYFFTGKYEKSTVQLKKALEMYEKLAPLNNVDRATLLENQSKREILYKYIALSSEYNDKSDAAIAIYQTLLKEKNLAVNHEDTSLVYLELARLHSDRKEFDNALDYLSRAELALKSEKEIDLPEFHFRILWFIDFRVPFFTWGMDSVYMGENQIVFKLPTIHRREYLYSMRATIYKNLGDFENSRLNLEKLIQAADEEDNGHGEKVKNNAYIRLASLQFDRGDVIAARDAFNTALELAKDRKDVPLQTSIRQNLYYLLCFQVENEVFPLQQLSETLNTTIGEINEFVTKFEEDLLTKTRKKVKDDSNRDELTAKEIEDVKISSAKSLNRILLYRSIFETYLAQIQWKNREYRPIAPATVADQTPQYLLPFLTQERQYFDLLNKPKNRFEGFLFDDRKDNATNFIQPKDLRLKLILTLNRGRIYANLNLQLRALKEFNEALELADEFQDYLFMASAHYQLFLAKKNLGIEGAVIHLDIAAKIFSSNFQLVNERPDLYLSIQNAKLGVAADRQDAMEVAAVAETLRFARSWPQMMKHLSIGEAALAKLYNQFRQVLTVQSTLMADIAELRYGRQDSKDLELLLTKILAQKNEIIANIRKYQARPGFAAVILDDELKLAQILDKYNVVYFSRFENSLLVNLFQAGSSKELLRINIEGDRLEKLRAELNSFTRENPNQPLWLKKISELNPDIIIENADTAGFPFFKVVTKPLIQAYSLRALLSMQNNQKVQMSQSFKLAIAENTEASGTGDLIVSSAELKKNAIQIESIEINRTSETSVLKASSALLQDHLFPAAIRIVEPAVTKMTVPDFDIRNAEALLLAASGATTITYGPASGGNLMTQLLSGGVNHSFFQTNRISANLAILRLFYGLTNLKTKPEITDLEKNWKQFIAQEQAVYKENFDRLLTQGRFTEALQIITKRERLLKTDLEVQKSYFGLKTSKPVIDFELQLAKIRLLMIGNQVNEALAAGNFIVQDYIQINKAEADIKKENIIRENNVLRYLSILFEFGYAGKAFDLLATLKQLPLQKSSILNFYFLYSLHLINSGLWQQLLTQTDKNFEVLAQRANFTLPKDSNSIVDFLLSYSPKNRVWKNLHESTAIDMLWGSQVFLEKNLDTANFILMQRLFDNWISPQKTALYNRANASELEKKITTFLQSGSYLDLTTIDAVELDPAVFSYLSGYYYLRQKNYASAIQNFSEALAKHNDFSVLLGDVIWGDLMSEMSLKSLPANDAKSLTEAIVNLIQLLPEPRNPQRKKTHELMHLFARSFAGYDGVKENLTEIEKQLAQLSFVNQQLYLKVITNLFAQDPENIREITIGRFPANPANEKIQSLLARVQFAIKEAKMPVKLEDPLEFNLLLNYYLNQEDYSAAIKIMALYDRNEKLSSKSPFESVVIGFFPAFEGKIAFWQWQEEDISIDIVNSDQITFKMKNLALRDSVVVYLNNRLDQLDILQYSQFDTFVFTATLNPKPVFASPLNNLLSWSGSGDNDAMKSILRINLGNQNSATASFKIKENPGDELKLVNFYKSQYSFKEFLPQLKNSNSGNWHILSTDRQKNNVYLSFLNEYFIALQQNQVRRKDGKVDLAQVFLTAKKRIKTNYRLAADYNSVVLILN